MAPVLTRSLASLRAEFDLIAPNRDRTSDGWIGDLSHQATKSGHNPDRTGNAEYPDGDALDEVRAIDVDKDLGSGLSMLKIIERILATPKDRRRLKYIIFNRVIWSASSGWAPRRYTGSNPHDKHAHFSGNPEYDSDTSAWSVRSWKEEDMDANQWEFIQNKLNTIDKQSAAAAGRTDGLMRMADVTASWSTLNPTGVDENQLADVVDKLAADVAEIKARPPVPIDPIALAEALRVVVAQVVPAAVAAAIEKVQFTARVGE